MPKKILALFTLLMLVATGCSVNSSSYIEPLERQISALGGYVPLFVYTSPPCKMVYVENTPTIEVMKSPAEQWNERLERQYVAEKCYGSSRILVETNVYHTKESESNPDTLPDFIIGWHTNQTRAWEPIEDPAFTIAINYKINYDFFIRFDLTKFDFPEVLRFYSEERWVMILPDDVPREYLAEPQFQHSHQVFVPAKFYAKENGKYKLVMEIDRYPVKTSFNVYPEPLFDEESSFGKLLWEFVRQNGGTRGQYEKLIAPPLPGFNLIQ